MSNNPAPCGSDKPHKAHEHRTYTPINAKGFTDVHIKWCEGIPALPSERTCGCDHGYDHWGKCPTCNAAGFATTPLVGPSEPVAPAEPTCKCPPGTRPYPTAAAALRATPTDDAVWYKCPKCDYHGTNPPQVQVKSWTCRCGEHYVMRSAPSAGEKE